MTIGWSEYAGKKIAAIASRHGFGIGAAEAMAESLLNGKGGMAQFNHPELGGMGQWSRGGMLMIGDMFNNALKVRVGSLAEALAEALSTGSSVRPGDTPPVAEGSTPAKSKGNIRPTLPPEGDHTPSQFSAGGGWPRHLGTPTATGAQNGRRYAVFQASQLFAVETDGRIRLYDTGDCRISGVSQTQNGGDRLRLTGENGDIDLSDLVEVEDSKSSKSITS